MIRLYYYVFFLRSISIAVICPSSMPHAWTPTSAGTKKTMSLVAISGDQRFVGPCLKIFLSQKELKSG